MCSQETLTIRVPASSFDLESSSFFFFSCFSTRQKNPFDRSLGDDDGNGDDDCNDDDDDCYDDDDGNGGGKDNVNAGNDSHGDGSNSVGQIQAGLDDNR